MGLADCSGVTVDFSLSLEAGDDEGEYIGVGESQLDDGSDFSMTFTAELEHDSYNRGSTLGFESRFRDCEVEGVGEVACFSADLNWYEDDDELAGGLNSFPVNGSCSVEVER